jgi:hypothetical protein
MDQLDQFLGLEIYTRAELLSTLGTLPSGEVVSMIMRAAIAAWEREYSSGPKFQPTDSKFPLEDPHWNKNDPANRKDMGDLRNVIIKAIKESVPSPKT